MGLAEEADSTEVGAILPDDGQEGQVALTRPGNLSAGEDADAIGIQEQTDHHDGIEGRGAAGLVLVGGMDPREIERGDDIDQEEHEVVLRELGGGGVGPLGVELRCPRAIRFGAGWVHDRSHVRMGEDPSSSSPYGKIAQATKLSRSSESAVGFIDSLLGQVNKVELPTMSAQRRRAGAEEVGRMKQSVTASSRVPPLRRGHGGRFPRTDTREEDSSRDFRPEVQVVTMKVR